MRLFRLSHAPMVTALIAGLLSVVIAPAHALSPEAAAKDPESNEAPAIDNAINDIEISDELAKKAGIDAPQTDASESDAPEIDAAESFAVEAIEETTNPDAAPEDGSEAVEAVTEKAAIEESADASEETPPAEPNIAEDKVAEDEVAEFNLEGRATPAMWRLKDADSEVWILGTFHILPPELDWRSDPLARAIDAAETLYFEAEVDTPDAQKTTIDLLTKEGFLAEGQTLRSLLSDEGGEKFTEIVAELGLPLETMDTMRPWQAFLVMSVQYITAKGFTPGSGVETVLLQEARLRGRDLEFFETAEQQIRLFTDLDAETELNLLELTIQEWDTQDEAFVSLFNAWRAGDTATIDTLMNDAMRRQFPDVFERLLIERNKNWAAEIETIMDGRGKVLIAVGAAHLIGEQSVPALLEDAGLTVERYGLD